ncbi:MAG: DUF2848 domain-containing protein [Desulfobacteraceae bacterium]|nr:MAG: DUF2848 domain-containing protein [Desulfobacteraceae bacterium]
MENILRLSVQRRSLPAREIDFRVERQFNAGWVGRDRKALQHHIDELARLGVPAPKHIPTLFSLGNHLLATSESIQVHGEETSGEVEWVLLRHRGEMLIGVGSDHTDRKLEIHSVPKAKNMCLNVMAPSVWPYEEVKEHFDRLVLECTVEKDGETRLYQRDICGAILDPTYWTRFLEKRLGALEDGFVLFSGTIGTLGGLVMGKAYGFSIIDPVLKRSISHRYACTVMTGAIEDY